MKRSIVTIVIISLIILLGYGIFKVKEVKADIQTNGITISTEEFKEVYMGEESERMSIDSAQSVKDAKLTIRDIKIEDEQVSFYVELIVDRQKIHFPITGILGKGFKYQQDANSIILQIYEQVEGYEFLLFEIFNDSNDIFSSLLDGTLYEKKDFTKNPHIKIYMKDIDNTIYLFETEMIEKFSQLEAVNYEEADTRKDAMGWLFPFIK